MLLFGYSLIFLSLVFLLGVVLLYFLSLGELWCCIGFCLFFERELKVGWEGRERECGRTWGRGRYNQNTFRVKNGKAQCFFFLSCWKYWMKWAREGCVSGGEKWVWIGSEQTLILKIHDQKQPSLILFPFISLQSPFTLNVHFERACPGLGQ